MRIKATKMDGCGNSFLVVDEMNTPLAGFDRSAIAKALANQHDTDGILYVDVDQSEKMPSMKIFDCDGTEETMCGNGLRCATRYFRDTYVAYDNFSIVTGDGRKEVSVINDLTEVDLGVVRDYRQISDHMYFVFTGVPHIVVTGSEITLEHARIMGKSLREDRSLCAWVGHPEGVNVNFIWRDQEGIAVRTFEVGVEDVTLSCGTGSAASAFVATQVFGISLPVFTHSLGGRLRISEIGGHLSIRGQTRYQGKVIGFVNTVYSKPIFPVDHRHHQHYW